LIFSFPKLQIVSDSNVKNNLNEILLFNHFQYMLNKFVTLQKK